MAVRKRHIRMLVERLLSGQGINSAPVDVDALADAAGVLVQMTPADDSLSGFLLKDASRGRAVIGVNSTHHPNRRRFTVAHELGHFLLHEGERIHIDRSGQGFQINLRSDKSSAGSDVEEIEANLFAAELLMPAMFIKADLARWERIDLLDDAATEEMLRTLAAKYQVSTQALTYRLVNLGFVQL